MYKDDMRMEQQSYKEQNGPEQMLGQDTQYQPDCSQLGSAKSYPLQTQHSRNTTSWHHAAMRGRQQDKRTCEHGAEAGADRQVGGHPWRHDAAGGAHLLLLLLTVVDTPGLGDIINNTNCWQPITGYLDEQSSQFLEAETRVERGPERADRRVHGLLYFLPPTGHGLRAVDIETMKRLQDKGRRTPSPGRSWRTSNRRCGPSWRRAG